MNVLLANDLESFGLYPTIVLATVAVFVLAYLIRAIENYVRHLHKKAYLPYGNPRFILTVIGAPLVVDGFIVGGVFQERLPLHAATVTTSAGLLCLIASAVISIIPHVRDIRQVDRPDSATGSDNDGSDDRPAP